MSAGSAVSNTPFVRAPGNDPARRWGSEIRTAGPPHELWAVALSRSGGAARTPELRLVVLSGDPHRQDTVYLYSCQGKTDPIPRTLSAAGDLRQKWYMFSFICLEFELITGLD